LLRGLLHFYLPISDLKCTSYSSPLSSALVSPHLPAHTGQH
jgi:hypothetical protein